MGRNMFKWVDEMIASKDKKAMPVLSFPSIQRLNVTVEEIVKNSDKQAEGIKIIADSFDTAAAVSYMDLSVEAEAFGSTIRYSRDEVPTVIGSIISSMEEAEALKVPEVGAGRTGSNVEAMKKARAMVTDRPLFTGIIGPFSLAGRLMDVSEAMIYCYDEPEMVHEVLGKVTEFLISYCRAFKDTGVDGVVVAEPLAGLLSGDLAEEFSAEYVKKLVSAVQDEEFLIVYHNCGNSTVRTIDTIINNGCRMFHFGNAIDMKEMMSHIPADCIAMGNVDPATEFRNGTPESVYAATEKLLKDCGGYDNFVISSGCDIPAKTPLENIDKFFEVIDLGYYKAKLWGQITRHYQIPQV